MNIVFNYIYIFSMNTVLIEKCTYITCVHAECFCLLGMRLAFSVMLRPTFSEICQAYTYARHSNANLRSVHTDGFAPFCLVRHLVKWDSLQQL